MLRFQITRIVCVLVFVAVNGCGGSDDNRQAVNSNSNSNSTAAVASGNESPELLAIRRDLEAGKTKEVADALKPMLAAAPDDGQLLALRARLELQSGKGLSARETIERAVELAPQVAEVWSTRGEIQMLGGDFQSADESFCKSLELRPNDARTLYARAMTRAAVDRLEEALQDFAAAAVAQPDQPALFFANRATLLLKLSKPAEALIDARMAVSRADEDIEMKGRGYGLVVQSSMALKETETAIAACDELVKLAPGNVDFRLLRAQVLRAAGDERAATADESMAKGMVALQRVEQALSRKPDDAALHRKRGLLRLELGETPETALADFDAAVRLSPDDPEMYLARCAVWFRTGDFKRVERECRTAIEIRDVPAIHAVLGDLRLLQNQPDLAIEEYRLARRFDANVARAYRLRAALREKDGDSAGAKSDIQQASFLEGDEPNDTPTASGVRRASFELESGNDVQEPSDTAQPADDLPAEGDLREAPLEDEAPRGD